MGKRKPPALYFNADMFVFEPSMETYHHHLKTLQITPPTSFAEQDFLNMEGREYGEREEVKMLVKKWWDIYNDESLDYKK
ncbi:galactinol synthase 1 [Senna tora]|uniref:Galactinol synthase 1 n=1 Tax=Senna tora TaxID=362788 RepID=A0A834THH4_9FABA|nr:galactinol synthase 1 [Senna tora]